MKTKIIFLMLLVMFVSINNVSAEEQYYNNKYNVTLTKEEYDFLSKFYWEGYQEDMTLEDYQEFIKSDIINGEFESFELDESKKQCIVPYDTSHETDSKIIKISKTCTTICQISVVVTWKTILNTKSYDVIGAYLEGINIVGKPSTRAKTSKESNTSSDVRNFNNGFGTSILLPSSGNEYIISQTYNVSKGGIVHASYQHAKKAISLVNSKNYTISSSGYGGVFSFSGTALNVYDKMGGVSITV